MDRLSAAATHTFTERNNRKLVTALPAGLEPRDESESYLIQDQLHEMMIPSHGSVTGYKKWVAQPELCNSFWVLPSLAPAQ